MGVRSKNGTLFLDFRWRGVRCREFTELADTPEHRRQCEAVMKIIHAEIELGTFDYRRHFPNGARLTDFYPEVATSKPTVEAYLIAWHARRSPFRPDGSVVAAAELHPSTWKHDQSVIVHRLIPAFGDLRLDALTLGACRDYRRELQDTAYLGRP